MVFIVPAETDRNDQHTQAPAQDTQPDHSTPQRPGSVMIRGRATGWATGITQPGFIHSSSRSSSSFSLRSAAACARSSNPLVAVGGHRGTASFQRGSASLPHLAIAALPDAACLGQTAVRRVAMCCVPAFPDGTHLSWHRRARRAAATARTACSGSGDAPVVPRERAGQLGPVEPEHSRPLEDAGCPGLVLPRPMKPGHAPGPGSPVTAVLPSLDSALRAGNAGTRVPRLSQRRVRDCRINAAPLCDKGEIFGHRSMIAGQPAPRS